MSMHVAEVFFQNRINKSVLMEFPQSFLGETADNIPALYSFD